MHRKRNNAAISPQAANDVAINLLSAIMALVALMKCDGKLLFVYDDVRQICHCGAQYQVSQLNVV